MLAFLCSLGKVLPMPASKRNSAEQKLWDAIVLALIGKCWDAGPEGCAHAVREIADAVIVERRRSQGDSK